MSKSPAFVIEKGEIDASLACSSCSNCPDPLVSLERSSSGDLYIKAPVENIEVCQLYVTDLSTSLTLNL